jgi:signal transduction histidine kinase
MRFSPALDGYSDDWLAHEDGLDFSSTDGVINLHLLAGRGRDRLYFLAEVTDTTHQRIGDAGASGRPSGAHDAVQLFLRGSRGQQHYLISTAAPGLFQLNSRGGGSGQLEGFWLDRNGGYSVEMSVPLPDDLAGISIGIVDPLAAGFREAGMLEGQKPAVWLSPVEPDDELKTWLDLVLPDQSRAWVVDADGWIMADTGPAPASVGQQLSWAQRALYGVVAGSRTELERERPERMVRLRDPVVDSALAGTESMHWAQDPENAKVRNTVAVPLMVDGEVRGALVMETDTDGLLLVTNRALGRLLATTLLLTFVLAAGLWWFATRLSHRVQRLSGAVSRAMDDAGKPGELPLTTDGDELGELARNNQRLLRAVADYTRYLKNLASRLSHELKTPLAITRSSLENLSSRPLDDEAARYLERAREGLDRQSAIVRAMSEASRLEAAVQAADWTEVELNDLLRNCVEAYRCVHSPREIALKLPDDPVVFHCAPDLLAQALDKLVDNAISMTGHDDLVEVELAQGDRGAVISVRNSGSSLPETLQDQLFDSLVSVREQRGEIPHLGLGLYIVRLVAEAHGGTVSARNLEPVQGVVFTIRLPIA